MAFDERFYIDKPVASGGVAEIKFDGKTKTLPTYRATTGQLLIWSDHDGDNPLPNVGDKIMVTMNNIGPAIVDGYFVAGDTEGEMYLGVMTKALAPPKWLREQRKRDQNEDRPEWYKQGIGCEFPTEFRPYKRGDMTKHRKRLKESGR